eukprot:2338695-Pleurochrysis_carterae.AAC.1
MGSHPSRAVADEPARLPQSSHSFSTHSRELAETMKRLNPMPSFSSVSSLPKHRLMVSTSNSIIDLSQQPSPALDTGRPGSAAKYQRLRVRCCTGDVLNLDVRPTTSMTALKVKIARHLLATAGYYPPSSMRLVFNSKVLPEVGTLLSLQIVDGSRIVMATVCARPLARNGDTVVSNHQNSDF